MSEAQTLAHLLSNVPQNKLSPLPATSNLQPGHVHAPGLVSPQSAFACLSTLFLLPFQHLKYTLKHHIHVRFPGGSNGKEYSCNAGDPGSIPGSGRSPGKRNGYQLQYSCLENSTDRARWASP